MINVLTVDNWEENKIIENQILRQKFFGNWLMLVASIQDGWSLNLSTVGVFVTHKKYLDSLLN